ncbi:MULTISPECIES: nucleotidyl transferase AbiEii/AbiGii toxin family protein [unclassified Citrobacter]|nr:MULTISPECIES: nucleotidyl transferase AbiEii/AbiGii toxin family protein [unclassified Citrobacter]MBA7878291.1 nucleotidyl transferase AbiEii/AbiGii toxin family protein [Citrobacter sp. RHBSTW-00827]MBA7941004.1 nucleotidyl transferase AbiEii/AbiGii toxin family protein [Citrobacter sp. RHBSTW-00509]QLS97700.1 nucleotidyl transferase AbiEii/AbiGii toxin family protein [Citrobacter sp. RHBSTW-00859]QLT57148.1 nucleotidyl transferase AbiEii/AbiGii toxin family protein [Citrobacter sp. RHBSTW
MEYSIEDWVGEAPRDRVVFRQAVHIVLSAIASSDYLRPKMIMKGGMLLGIRYRSTRFTEDIDFSTKMKLSELDEDEFRRELNEALLISSDSLPYGVFCAIQSLGIQPKKNYENATFPSFNLKIGYARKSVSGEMERLERGQSPNTIKIDYSFNEISFDVDDLVLDDDGVQSYNITDLMAEKIRSIIQQPYRNRNRRQDIYDLNYLFNCVSLDDDERFAVLTSLILKSEGRIPKEDIHCNTLDREDIKEHSAKDYGTLSQEVSGDIPDFEYAYNKVNDFYKSLPWDLLVNKEGE